MTRAEKFWKRRAERAERALAKREQTIVSIINAGDGILSSVRLRLQRAGIEVRT